MDFEEKETVSEEEIDALGIKKKDDADVDDALTDDVVVPTDLDDEEKEEEDKGIFGDDKAFEDQLLDPYGDRDNY